jgi:2-polyprenyl-3-methyl-5-hydroxy-6-metoxy-1,4-benzoquinol methylase
LRLVAPIISFFKYKDSIPYIPNAKALDVGCGNGKFMSRMNSIGWKMEGLDFSPLAIEICRKSGLKVTYGDLLSASFPNNSFDVVSARHVLEHVPNPEKFVIEIQRILKKGGLFVIRTPNSQALGRKWFGTNWYANDVPRHLFLFSFKNMDMLTQRNGLQLVYSKYFTTKKIFLKSKKIQTRNQRPSFSQKIIWRFFSYFYILLSALTRQGDEIFAIYKKYE